MIQSAGKPSRRNNPFSRDKARHHKDELPDVSHPRIKQKVTKSAGNPRRKKKKSKSLENDRRGRKEDQKEDETQSVDSGEESNNGHLPETQLDGPEAKKVGSGFKVVSKSARKKQWKMDREGYPKGN